MDAPTDPHRRYLDRFAPLADHVRRNLRGDLSVEALARTVHFSPFHFHRLFTAVMGETVGTFVRRARLERAVQLMRTRPDRSLSRVARTVGFGSLSAFSRAFRRAYGLAPSRWDRRSRLTSRARETHPAAPAGVPDLSELIAAGDGPAAEVRLRDLPPLTLAYVRVRRPWEPGALEGAYAKLREWLDRQDLERRELLGISWDDVEVTPPEHIRYDFAASVPPGTQGGGLVAVREWPASLVAASRARGTLARVARVWDDLYKEWLPRSRFEPRDLPPFERYHGWPEAVDGEWWDLDCCVPVKRV